MADIIIIAILATAVFFILRGQVRRLRAGQCGGGCAGCSACGSSRGGSCGSCSGCAPDGAAPAAGERAE